MKLTKLVKALLCATALPASLAAFAQTNENLHDCDRACLIKIGEQYLQAVGKHDPKAAPISPDARYTENAQELVMPDGIWRTITKVGDYRLYVADPEFGMLGMFSVMEENGWPIILASRLKVREGKITEIETVVARRDTAPGQPSTGGFQPEPQNLKPRAQFTDILPMEKRRPRWQLIEIANSYFRALESNNGTDHVPPFADDCHRFENGIPTTNAPLINNDVKPTSANMACKEAFGLGYYREDTRLRDMRFLAVDEERGLVFVQGYFDHDAAVRSYKLTDGRTNTVSRTSPWTWMMMETFQITDGKISQVEAALLSVPYGMRSPWNNGVHLPSYQDEIEKMQH